jgi:class 3 adenylate cyclase
MHRSQVLLFVAIALSIGIFILDTLSPLQFAVAVLYVVVVLISAAFHRQRVVLMTSAACVVLTILSYLLVHGFRIAGAAPLRAIMSLAAIGITTLLVLDNLSKNERFRAAERQRTKLARFFSPQRVEQLVRIDGPQSISRQLAAVLFVDMIDSTAYFSKMAPDAVIAILRDLLTLLSTSVFTHNGMIEKFLGDGLMAVFGVAMPSPTDATNAVRCAMDMQQSVDQWNERCGRSGDEAIRVAVGIHYGDVVQGDVGSDEHMELTVVGDTVNIARRVETHCRSLEAAVLVTGALVDSLHAEGSDSIAGRFKDEGFHVLRGRREPIRLHSVRRPPRS